MEPALFRADAWFFPPFSLGGFMFLANSQLVCLIWAEPVIWGHVQINERCTLQGGQFWARQHVLHKHETCHVQRKKPSSYATHGTLVHLNAQMECTFQRAFGQAGFLYTPFVCFTWNDIRWETFRVRAPTLLSPPYTCKPGSIFTSFSLPPAWSLEGQNVRLWRLWMTHTQGTASFVHKAQLVLVSLTSANSTQGRGHNSLHPVYDVQVIPQSTEALFVWFF